MSNMAMMGHGPGQNMMQGPGPAPGQHGQGMPNYGQQGMMPMSSQQMQGPMSGYNQGMPVMAGQGMPHAMNQPPQQQKEVNTIELCRVGHETTQEIANKTTEVFQMLKTLQVHCFIVL